MPIEVMPRPILKFQNGVGGKGGVKQTELHWVTSPTPASSQLASSR